MEPRDRQEISAHPYTSLPSSAFWRQAVADKPHSEIGPLWRPKFGLELTDPVATFGSCFAQHIGRALKGRGFNWMDTEPSPSFMPAALSAEYNYGVFTCRTGNIYTTSLLLQWTRWALGVAKPPAEIWKRDGRYYDPFRPAIEPNGFISADEVLEQRDKTIQAFHTAIKDASCFVFTLGLTESWLNRGGGYEYPTCPGTVAGDFDGAEHSFHNLQFREILKSLQKAINLMRKINPNLKFLVTVSPVPLTATNSGNHVLVATMESKSILRAVAAQLTRDFSFVDYFPSYEIVNSPVFRGEFFESNLRTVSRLGVDFVMDHFFKCLSFVPAAESQRSPLPKPAPSQNSRARKVRSAEDVVCEEELLAAFGH